MSAKQRDRESAWIEWIRRLAGPAAGRVRLGIGDDAAVWDARGAEHLVLTVDAQVDGTHFRRGWLRPRELGRRAVSVSLSDLAAMAAQPGALLVSLVVDRSMTTAEFRAMYRGIFDASEAYGAPIIGGNLSRGPLSITVTAIGHGGERHLCLRAGLRGGEEIWVTGAPGLARLGLRALAGKADRRRFAPAVRAFKAPTARLREARALARGGGVTSLIDLSDGLAVDLEHLLEAPRRRGEARGFELEVGAFDELQPLARLAAIAGLSPLDVALAGGEDYELCFAAPPGHWTPRRVAAFTRRFSLPLTRIGRVVERAGLWALEPDGSRRKLRAKSWRHF